MHPALKQAINDLFEAALFASKEGEAVDFASWFWNNGFRVLPRVDLEWQQEQQGNKWRKQMVELAKKQAIEADRKYQK